MPPVGRDEMAERSETDGEASVRDAGPVAKACGGVRQANVGKKTMRRSALEFRKDPREVKQAHPRVARESR